MTFQEIQELIKLLNKSNLAEFKVEDGDFKLSIRTALYAEAKSNQVFSAPMQQMAPSVSSAAPANAAPAPAPAPVASIQNPNAAAPKAEATGQGYLEVKSPMVGTFYRSATPEKQVYVEIGQKVKKGEVVCIIEAMKLFNEIESEVSGTIVKVMLDNAQPVEYDQVLFLVEPD